MGGGDSDFIQTRFLGFKILNFAILLGVEVLSTIWVSQF